MTRDISSIVKERASTIEKIERKTQKLARDFEKDPLNIRTKKVYDLIQELVSLNDEFNKTNERENSRCFGRKNVKILGISWGIGTCAGIVLQLVASLTEEESSCEGTPALNPIGVAVTGIAAGLGALYAYRKESDSIYAQNALIESANEKNFLRFLSALKEYGKADKKSQHVESKLIACLQNYESIPVHYQCFPKEVLVTQLILSLPKKHPLRAKLASLEKKALELFAADIDSEGKFAGEKAGPPSFLEEDETTLESYQNEWEELERSLSLPLTSLKTPKALLTKKNYTASFGSDENL